MTDSAEAVIGMYERHAYAWDSARGPVLHERPWLGRFTELLPPGGSILDIGCGSGDPIARFLVAQHFGVTGIDSSATLIEIARARFPKASWLVGDMRELALGRPFHGLIAWHSLFHLTTDDQHPMFERFRRHAQSGTMLLFTSGPERSEALSDFEGEPLYHASLDPHEYRELLARNGFEVVAHKERDPECGEATVWLARFVDVYPGP